MNAKPSTWIFQFYFMTPAASRYEFVAHPLEKIGKKSRAPFSKRLYQKSKHTVCSASNRILLKDFVVKWRGQE
jgi:hypothetical protein